MLFLLDNTALSPHRLQTLYTFFIGAVALDPFVVKPFSQLVLGTKALKTQPRYCSITSFVDIFVHYNQQSSHAKPFCCHSKSCSLEYKIKTSHVLAKWFQEGFT